MQLERRDSELDRYMNEIEQFPVLSHEEQLFLSKKVFHDNCIESAQKLITHNLRLVTKLAFEYTGYQMPMLDLIQEGTIGLMIAVRKFDPYRDIKLSTYAANWIHAYIKKYIMYNYSIVKLGTNQDSIKLFWNGDYQNIDDSLDIEINADDQQLITKKDKLVCDRPNQEDLFLDFEQDQELQEDIKLALSKLTPRQQTVAYYRFFYEEHLTLREIASILQISTERVRQLEECVLIGLRKYLSEKYS